MPQRQLELSRECGHHEAMAMTASLRVGGERRRGAPLALIA